MNRKVKGRLGIYSAFQDYFYISTEESVNASEQNMFNELAGGACEISL